MQLEKHHIKRSARDLRGNKIFCIVISRLIIFFIWYRTFNFVNVRFFSSSLEYI